MVEGIGDAAVTISVIGNPVPANPIPESEMDALLLGRTKVSCQHRTLSVLVCDVFSCMSHIRGRFAGNKTHSTNLSDSATTTTRSIPISNESICGYMLKHRASLFVFALFPRAGLPTR